MSSWWLFRTERSRKPLWKGLHWGILSWMKVGREPHTSLQEPGSQKGERQVPRLLERQSLTRLQWVSIPPRAMICKYTHAFFSGAKYTNKQTFFPHHPRVQINGNTWLSIFEPWGAKTNSWKRSRESSCGFQSIKIYFFPTQNQVSWTKCILLGLQSKTGSPSGVQSLEYRLLILRNSLGWCFRSISEMAISRMKQKSVGKQQRI